MADDEPAILRAVSRMLERAGHVVRTAGTAQEALRLTEREAFDVVVADAHMPGDGRTILAALSKRADFGGRLFLMTGSLPDDIRDLPPGVRRLQKPFDFAEFLSMVEEA